MEESWKDIEGYEGLYQVSNKGRVKSLVNHKGVAREKVLKPEIVNGYKRVMLHKNKTIKHLLVHRLVANAFLPNPHNFPCVNHKDENKQNNVVSNLEWCTQKYNCNYGTGISRCAKALSKQVYQYSKDGVLIAVWESTAECGRNGYNSGAVSSCCNGKLKTHKGYIWSYTPLT